MNRLAAFTIAASLAAIATVEVGEAVGMAQYFGEAIADEKMADVVSVYCEQAGPGEHFFGLGEFIERADHAEQ
jgi:hypothetical protein